MLNIGQNEIWPPQSRNSITHLTLVYNQLLHDGWIIHANSFLVKYFSSLACTLYKTCWNSKYWNNLDNILHSPVSFCPRPHVLETRVIVKISTHPCNQKPLTAFHRIRQKVQRFLDSKDKFRWQGLYNKRSFPKYPFGLNTV